MDLNGKIDRFLVKMTFLRSHGESGKILKRGFSEKK
jgi:hypothetical protein